MTAIVDAVWLCEPHGLSNLLPSALEASEHFLNSTSAECRLFNASVVASYVLCTLVEREKKFSGHGGNCQRNVTDLAGSLVTSSRPPGRLQKRPDDRTQNAGVAVRTADGSRRTADAVEPYSVP